VLDVWLKYGDVVDSTYVGSYFRSFQESDHGNHYQRGIGTAGVAADYHKISPSAAVGGVTTVINVMRSNRSYLEQLPEELALGQKESVIDFCYHLGVMTSLHLYELSDYVTKLGVASFKLYFGYRGL